MSYLPASTLAHIRTASADAREVDQQSIVIDRNGTDLAAQTVRIVRSGRGRNQTIDRSEMRESEMGVVVIGATDLDIQLGDYFNDDNGDLYYVEFVQPNRTIHTKADARLVQ